MNNRNLSIAFAKKLLIFYLLAQGVQQSLLNKVDSSPRKHVCEHNNFMTTMDRYYGHYAKGITL